jgi:glycosyltransferase involved in cell wall biosynthesis
MSRINVLMVSDHISYNGKIHGVGRFFYIVIPYFDRDKYKVVLCVLRRKDSSDDLFKAQRIAIKYIEKGKFDPATLMSLLKIIKEERIDVLHLHGYRASNFGRIAALAMKIPTIVHCHDNNPNYPLYQGIADLILTHFTDKVIAVSEFAKESAIKKRKFSESKVIVMHNAIPLKKFHELDADQIEKEKIRLGIYSDYKVIGTVTRLREEKGNKYLIEAAAEVLKVFPKTIFLIVGDGPLREDLQNFCKKLNIEKNVIFCGFSEEIQKVYSVFDIKVIASLTEGFSFALVEAMAMGKAIVSTDAGGPKEIIKDGKTGLLVPPKSSTELAQKLIFLLKNEQEIKKLGQNAREESKKYDIDLYIKKLETIYSMHNIAKNTLLSRNELK